MDPVLIVPSRRLFLIAFVVSVPLGFLMSSGRWLTQILYGLGVPFDQMSFYFSALGLISQVIDPVVLFMAVYLASRRLDLQFHYKPALLGLFLGAWAGNYVGWTAGFGLLSSLPREIEFWVFPAVFLGLPQAVGILFVGFTAASLAYLRRRSQAEVVAGEERVEGEELGDSNEPPVSGLARFLGRTGQDLALMNRKVLLLAFIVSITLGFMTSYNQRLWDILAREQDFTQIFTFQSYSWLILPVLYPLLLFIAVYLASRRVELKSQYRSVVLSLFLGGLVGYSLGQPAGSALAGSLLGSQTMFGPDFSVLGSVSTTLERALNVVFVGFTAASLQFLRKTARTHRIELDLKGQEPLGARVEAATLPKKGTQGVRMRWKVVFGLIAMLVIAVVVGSLIKEEGAVPGEVLVNTTTVLSVADLLTVDAIRLDKGDSVEVGFRVFPGYGDACVSIREMLGEGDDSVAFKNLYVHCGGEHDFVWTALNDGTYLVEFWSGEDGAMTDVRVVIKRASS